MDAKDPLTPQESMFPCQSVWEAWKQHYCLNQLQKKGILGLDIMEVCPNYDIEDRTSHHLASRMMAEIISSM
jgi:agmatinase